MKNPIINGDIEANKFNNIIFDLLIDVLASNKDLSDKLDSIFPDNSFDLENSENRVHVLEYLKEKYQI
jgi:hypothetical protein